MKTKEFLNFIGKRIKNDSPLAFTCRMARFGVLLPFVLKRSMVCEGVSDIFEGNHILRDVQGSKMYLDITDKGLSQDLLLNGIREPYITKSVQQELHADDVCLDIGANIGYYVLQEARYAKKVYAIEPVKESVELLQKNIKANNYNNVEVFQLACGDKNSVDYINVSEKRNWSSMYSSNGREFVRRDEIKVVTVDEFIKGKQTPTFIRMDVEGYEYEIVKGMKELLSSGSPLKIFVEFHFDILRDKTVELARLLKDSGFKISVASIEPHPAIYRNKALVEIVKLFEKGIGATTGYVNVTIDDLINNRIYSSGQVEYLEILFERC
jgi:FkbM family methyltransferase